MLTASKRYVWAVWVNLSHVTRAGGSTWADAVAPKSTTHMICLDMKLAFQAGN